ncbi:MAG TPA: TonB-dependent receptor [Flavipsychrobacter sp.]|nr:TonB-dependent receptor [Flavipsychrobacter sp.]
MLSRLFTLLILFIAFHAGAQSVTVHVQNGESREALEFAYVNVYNSERVLQSSTLTDEDGNATVMINDFPAKLEVVATGYTSFSLPIKTITNQEIKVSLEKRFAALNEVIVTGVAAPIKAQNALASYKVITAASIKAQGAITLNEVLANQLNTNISNDGILGAGVRMQGMGGDKVKTLIDGIAVNGREGGNVDMGQISLFNVERIEMVQGPMSIIYGSDALGGVINVIEKQNRKPYELQATANYESIGKYNFNIGGAKSWKKHSVNLGGGRNYFQGWKYLDQPVGYNKDSALAQRHMLFKPKEQYVANAGYQYRATSGFKASLATNFLKENVTNKGPIQSYNPLSGVNAMDEYYYTTRSNNRLSLEGKINNKATWQILSGYAYYRRVRNTYITDLTTLTQDLSSAQGVQDTSVFQDITSRGMYQNKYKHFELTAGYDITLQNGISRKITGDNHTINDYAAFALATFPFFKEKLKLQTGLRAAHNTKFQSPLIPAVNILLSLNEKLQLRASYAKGFRAPSLKEMYLSFVDANHALTGNQNLRAETGHHLQLSLSRNLYKKQNNYAQLVLTTFYNHVKNGIMLVPLRPQDSTSIQYSYGNLSQQKNIIANLQLQGQWQNIYYTLGYAYNRTFAQAGYQAFNAQELNANVFYYYKKAKLHFATFYKYTGAQPFLRASIDGSANFDGRQPAYHMLDASVERKLWKNKASIVAGVKNIMDVQRLHASGLSTGGIHSGGGTMNFLPRSIFTTLRLTLD